MTSKGGKAGLSVFARNERRSWCRAYRERRRADPKQRQQRPNIVFVVIDDAGFSDFGAYGGEIQTPNIDDIAKSGVRFTNFHTASTCESSRHDAHRHRPSSGGRGLPEADHGRQPDRSTWLRGLPESQRAQPRAAHAGRRLRHLLRRQMEHGRRTRACARCEGLGPIHLARADRRRQLRGQVYAPLNMEAVWWEDGKRAVLPADFYSTRHYVDRMISYVEDGKDAHKPFFALLAFQAVHSPPAGIRGGH